MLTNRARLQENFLNRLLNSDLEDLQRETFREKLVKMAHELVATKASVPGGFSLWAWIRKQWAAIIKFLRVSFLLLIPVFAYSQESEKRDTLNGVALIYEQLNVMTEDGIKPMYQTVTIGAFSVTRYIILVDNSGNHTPQLLGVGYYRQEDCTPIPVKQIFSFRH